MKDRPDGSLSASLNLARIEEGTRATLSGGWARSLPGGRIAFDLGATRAAGGESGLTGSASWNHELKNGRIDARLRHGFAANSDDAESRVSSLSAGFTHALGPLTDMRFDLAYARTETASTGEETARKEFGAGLSHKLSEDWSLTLGYRRIYRRDEVTDWARSDSVHVTFGRAFSVRF